MLNFKYLLKLSNEVEINNDKTTSQRKKKISCLSLWLKKNVYIFIYRIISSHKYGKNNKREERMKRPNRNYALSIFKFLRPHNTQSYEIKTTAQQLQLNTH